jgi:uncharacterized protein YkwD
VTFIEFIVSLFKRRKPKPKPRPVPPPPPVFQPRPMEVLSEANLRRQAAGKPALVANEKLMGMAGDWAVQMATRLGLTHGDFAARMKGLHAPAAENIAAGQKSAAQVIQSWMDSPGHRKNLMGDYYSAGVGVDRSSTGVDYYCMIFVLGSPST